MNESNNISKLINLLLDEIEVQIFRIFRTIILRGGLK